MNSTEANRAILTLLKERHKEDIWDAEISLASGKRMDFWAAACSWAKPVIHGYEIKVARNDFVRDDKWPCYLDHCRQLSFVTAPGIVTLGEIPEQCGWIELSKNGARLMTRKKAPVREMEAKHEARIYKLLLMRKSGLGNEDAVDFWRRWLMKKREERQLGRVLRFEIAATVAEKLRKSAADIKEMQRRVEKAEIVEKAMEKLGIKPGSIYDSWQAERELRKRIEQATAGPIGEKLAAFTNHAAKLRTELAKLEELGRKFAHEVAEGMEKEEVA